MVGTQEVGLHLAFGGPHLVLQGLFTSGILVGDLHHPAHGGNVASSQVVSQEVIPYTMLEGIDGLVLRDVLDGVPELSPALNVCVEWIAFPLDTHPKVFDAPRTLVRALEVLEESVLEILPLMDAIHGETVKLRPSRPLQHQGKTPHGNVFIAATDRNGHPIVR